MNWFISNREHEQYAPRHQIDVVLACDLVESGGEAPRKTLFLPLKCGIWGLPGNRIGYLCFRIDNLKKIYIC